MNRLLTAAFALSLLGGAAANAQQPPDDHRHEGAGAPNRPPPNAQPVPQHGFGRPQGQQGGPRPGGPAQGAPNRGPQGQVGPQGFQGRPGGQFQGNFQGNRGSVPGQGARPGGQGFSNGGHVWRSPQRFQGRPYAFPRGFGYRQWAFGEYLPGPFFSNDYTLYDYWNYGLQQPPPGFEWVRVGPDALLVRPGDGYILDVAQGLFF